MAAAYLAAVAAGLAGTKVFTIVDIDLETSLPTWYAASQLLLVGLVFLVLASRLVPPDPRVSQLRPLWLVLGSGFVLLSIDEGAVVHERLTHVLDDLGFTANVNGGGQWMFFYLLLAVLGALVLYRYLFTAWREWRAEFLLFGAGFAVLALGAMGVEGASWFLRPSGDLKHWQVAIEELLEMVGVSIVCFSAIRVLACTVSAENNASGAGTVTGRSA